MTTVKTSERVLGPSTPFYPLAHGQVVEYLKRQGGGDGTSVHPLTPDASTRAYFRIPWKGKSAIATVYPEPFEAQTHPFLDVTRLFLDVSLPAPEIYAAEGSKGIIVQEDLGDRQLYRLYESETYSERDNYKEQAVSIIARIQAATPRAYEMNCIASRLSFDEPKLSWELDFFFEHYFKSLRAEVLAPEDALELKKEMNEIAVELAGRPRVLCHRDFHAANLIVDSRDHLRVIDYQDARMGPVSYDLVSLLLDRQPTPPSLAEIRAQRLSFLEERRKCGLEALDPDEFAREFRLMTIQRSLKAVGTFSYQSGVCGRGAVYNRFIRPTLLIMLQSAEWLNRFPALQRIIRLRVNDEVEDRSESEAD